MHNQMHHMWLWFSKQNITKKNYTHTQSLRSGIPLKSNTWLKGPVDILMETIIRVCVNAQTLSPVLTNNNLFYSNGA